MLSRRCGPYPHHAWLSIALQQQVHRLSLVSHQLCKTCCLGWVTILGCGSKFLLVSQMTSASVLVCRGAASLTCCCPLTALFSALQSFAREELNRRSELSTSMSVHLTSVFECLASVQRPHVICMPPACWRLDMGCSYSRYLRRGARCHPSRNSHPFRILLLSLTLAGLSWIPTEANAGGATSR